MRNLSKVIFKVAVLLILCTFFIGRTDITYAADKYSMHAESVNIAVGEGRTLFVNGLSSATSAVWTSEDESIATVNKNGVVKGVKIGETVVNVKIGKTKLQCKIHVLWPNQMKLQSQYIKKIAYSSYYLRNVSWRLQTDKSAYEITNNCDYPITIKGQLSYRADGKDTGVSKVESVTIPANDTGILYFDTSDEPEYEWTHSTDFYFVSITKAKSTFLTSKVKVTDKQLAIGNNPVAPIELTIKNNSGKDDVKFYVCVMYYDADDRFVGMEKISKKLKKGTTTIKTKPSKYIYNESFEPEFSDYTYEIFYVAYK